MRTLYAQSHCSTSALGLEIKFKLLERSVSDLVFLFEQRVTALVTSD